MHYHGCGVFRAWLQERAGLHQQPSDGEMHALLIARVGRAGPESIVALGAGCGDCCPAAGAGPRRHRPPGGRGDDGRLPRAGGCCRRRKACQCMPAGMGSAGRGALVRTEGALSERQRVGPALALHVAALRERVAAAGGAAGPCGTGSPGGVGAGAVGGERSPFAAAVVCAAGAPPEALGASALAGGHGVRGGEPDVCAAAALPGFAVGDGGPHGVVVARLAGACADGAACRSRKQTGDGGAVGAHGASVAAPALAAAGLEALAAAPPSPTAGRARRRLANPGSGHCARVGEL